MADPSVGDTVYDQYALLEEQVGGSTPLFDRDIIVARLIGKRDRVLDVGCGRGRLLEMIDAEEMHGVDLSKRGVEIACKKGIRAKVCDVEKERLPYPDGYFDVVICMELVEHLVDPVHALAEINRVLRRGGGVSANNTECGICDF